MKKIILLIVSGLFLSGLNAYCTDPLQPKKVSDNNIAGSPLPSPVPEKSGFIYPVWGFQISLAPGMSQLNNSDISSSDIWNSKGGFGFSFDAKYFKSFSPYTKILAGIGIDSYQQKIDIANYTTTFDNQTDIDGDEYDEMFSLQGVDESTKLTYFSIPLLFEYGNPNIDKLGFYIDAGIRFSFLVSDSYTGEGLYTTEGDYEQYHVHLSDIPELDLYNQKNINKTNAAIKSMNIAFQGGAGLTYPLSNLILLKAGITTNFGLTDLSDPQEKDLDASDPKYNFITSDNSLTANPESKTLSRFFGFEFGIFINRSLKKK